MTEMLERVPDVTVEELRKQLQTMSNRKSADTRGVVAELLKCSSDYFLEAVAEMFTDILQPEAAIPADWKMTRLKVLFKKGDSQLAGNYRPISILSILYKLFSRILCARIQVSLMKEQSVDQAAYRRGFSTEDHLLCTSLLAEKCSEWSTEVWFGLVDFEKSFDTVEHDSLWKAMANQGVDAAYINALKNLSCKQGVSIATRRQTRRPD